MRNTMQGQPKKDMYEVFIGDEKTFCLEINQAITL